MKHPDEFDPEDPLLRRLIDAGRDEAPTSEAFGRTVAALGIAATALSASASASAAASVTAGASASAGTGGIVKTAALGWGGLAKWLGIGFGAGLATFGAVEGARQVTATETPKAPVVAVATPAPRAVKSARVERAHAAEMPLIEPAAEPVEEELAAPAPRNANDPLGRELARLDAARAALHGGRPSQALVELERYAREHPRGRLLPEALVLRMQALERTGDAEGARVAARRLLETAPASPHAARARALLGAPR